LTPYLYKTICMKKHLLYSSLIGILISFASCNKLQQSLTFNIANESSFTVPATGPVNEPFDISSPDVTTNSSQAFAFYGVDSNDIINIYLTGLELTIPNPQEGQTFNFLRSVHVYISTNASNETELAYLDSVPSDVDSIALIPTQVILDQYIKAPSYNLRTEAVIDQGLTRDVTIEADSKFRVTANF
jgi:hypothetical protein